MTSKYPNGPDLSTAVAGPHAATHAAGQSDDLLSGWGHRYAGLVEPFPAWAATSNNTMSTSTLYLQYFRPDAAATITRLGYGPRGTASAGITLGRLGLYTVNTAGDVTLVGSTANDTTMGNTANTPYDAALTASVNLVRGSLYAFGILLVGTTPGNAAVGGQGMSGTMGSAWKGRDPLARFATGQTDLPATLATGAFSGGAQWFYTYGIAA